jgi:spore coat polysaccharide biosynthesis protein SpsF
LILAILQARMSSTRLPGKVMADVAGAPMILRQIERLKRSRLIGRIAVATSTKAEDTPLAEAVSAADVPVYRGSLDDVLDRYAAALEAFGPAEHVARLTADCPLVDPEVVDRTLQLHLDTGADYTANTPARRMFPKGLDVEVARAEALRRAAREATAPYEREHVTPFLYQHPDLFDLRFVTQEIDEGDVRWTVDRPDDLEFVRAVYCALYPADPAFTSDEVRALVRSRPDLHAFGGDRRV